MREDQKVLFPSPRESRESRLARPRGRDPRGAGPLQARGGLDLVRGVALNAVGLLLMRGTPLSEPAFLGFAHLVTAYTRTLFLTAKAVARRLVERGSGVILTISTAGSRATRGASETFSRDLSAAVRFGACSLLALESVTVAVAVP